MLHTNHSFPSLSLPAPSLQSNFNGEMFSFKLYSQVDIILGGDVIDHFTRLLGSHFEAEWMYVMCLCLCVSHKNIDDYFTRV